MRAERISGAEKIRAGSLLESQQDDMENRNKNEYYADRQFNDDTSY